jgi:hypothetical protein
MGSHFTPSQSISIANGWNLAANEIAQGSEELSVSNE